MSEKVFEPLGITAAYQASRLAPDVPVADLYYMGRVAKHANKKDEVRNHKGVSKPRLFA